MKIFLAVVAAFAAVMILLFVAPFVVPTSHYKEAVIDEINKFVDGEVTIDSFRFQILPYPAFTMRGVTVTTTKDPFKGVPVFHSAVIQGGLSPGPLVAGEIVTDFVIKDATFDYRIAADGTSNLSFLKPEKQDEHVGTYVIRSLLVTNGTFHYIKETQEKPVVVDQIELASSDLKMGEVLSGSVRMSAVLEGAVRQGLNVAGILSLDRNQKVVQARQLDLSFGESRFSVDGSFRYDTKSFDIHFATPSITLQSLAYVFPSLGRELPLGINFSGPFAIDASLAGTKDNVSVKCHADMTPSRIKLGSIFNKESRSPLKIVFLGTYQPTYITIEDVAFSFGENTFHLMGSVVNQPGYPAQLTLASTSFDANAVKPHFRFLTFFDELASPSISINVQGPLLQDTGRSISGHVTAQKATALNHTLLNLDADFQYAADVVTLSTLKGSLYDGALSGNGSIDLKSIPAFHFEVVADNLDTAKIPTLPAVMTGLASLVVKANASGMDVASIRESFSTEGTLVMSDGAVSSFKIGSLIFTDAVWKALEQFIPQGLDAATREGLASLGSDVKDMKASFNLKGGILSISEIAWSQPQYYLNVKGSISLPGEVAGAGDIFISKDVSARLIKDAAVLKAMTRGDGRLDVPFTVGGTLMVMSVRPDDAKLFDNLRRTAPPIMAAVSPAAPPAVSPPPPTTPPPAATQPAPTTPKPVPKVKKVKPKEEVETEAPPKPLKKKASKSEGKMSTDVDEDTLKVIIGQ